MDTEIMHIFNIKYNNISLENAVNSSYSIMDNQEKANIFFLNLNCLYIARKDKEYQDILNSSDLILSDGIGLRLVTRIFGGKMKDNCNGTDFSPIFMKEAAREGKKIFFLGGKDGVAERAAQNVKKQRQ